MSNSVTFVTHFVVTLNMNDREKNVPYRPSKSNSYHTFYTFSAHNNIYNAWIFTKPSDNKKWNKIKKVHTHTHIHNTHIRHEEKKTRECHAQTMSHDDVKHDYLHLLHKRPYKTERKFCIGMASAKRIQNNNVQEFCQTWLGRRPIIIVHRRRFFVSGKRQVIVVVVIWMTIVV